MLLEYAPWTLDGVNEATELYVWNWIEGRLL